jgi:peptidoglycan hydrolase-like protein with peptidoglycan-binding domain
MNPIALTTVMLKVFSMLRERGQAETPSHVPPPSSVPQAEYSVKWLQKSLNELLGAELDVDGDYGTKTRAAVAEFQKEQELKVDGWAGVQTCAAIVEQLERANA